jgi:hypothetical protein
MTRNARPYAPGEGAGAALVLSQPLSFWGGIDVDSGRIIDHSHPHRGASVTGAVLVMPAGRGSSSSASVLAESIRRATGPIAIVLSTADPILTVGALVAGSLYGARCPIVVCGIDGIATGDRVEVRATGDGPATVVVATPAV